MKFALAQMDVKPGQPKKNLETMLRFIKQAKVEGAQVVAFPEMAVGGYLLGDKWLDDSFCADLMAYNEPLREASEGITLIYGNIYVDTNVNNRWKASGIHPNKDGRSRKYNAVYVWQNGKPAKRATANNVVPEGISIKTLLPNYRFFDDERYFFSLQDVAADAGVELKELAQPFKVETDGKQILLGLEICEDLWCEDYRTDGKPVNITDTLVNNGADYIVNISASPWTHGKNAARDRRVQWLKKNGELAPLLYVNAVGAQNNGKNIVTFDGGTTAYNADGKPVKFDNGAHLEELITVSSQQLQHVGMTRTPKDKIAEKHDAIVRGIQHVKDITGTEHQPKYVIGLSGGVDSAVVAGLLVEAVGNERVLAVNMPTKYNSEKTKTAAKRIAEQLEIAYVELPIQDLVDTNERLLERSDIFDVPLSELNRENIQAKIRGTSILSNYAAKNGAIFTNNGNKVETALGYATLYGDVGGAIAPIGDLTKAEVFAMAHFLNNHVYGREVIPKELLPDKLFRFNDEQIQPSAELKNDQVDPIKIGYHCALLEKITDYNKASPEDIIEQYVEGTLTEYLGVSNELLSRWGIDNPKTFIEDLEWFTRSIQQNVFKRVQSPPNIITSKSAYGYDIRESQLPHVTSLRYDALKETLLGGTA